MIELMTRGAQLMAGADPAELALMKTDLDGRLAAVSQRLEQLEPGIDGERMLRLLRATIVGLSTFTATHPLHASPEELDWFHHELTIAMTALLSGLNP